MCLAVVHCWCVIGAFCFGMLRVDCALVCVDVRCFAVLFVLLRLVFGYVLSCFMLCV